MDFSGKVALITGAAGGIGRATALAFAKAGANVAVVDTNEAGAGEVAEAVKALGRKALAIPADVTNSQQVAGYVHRTVGDLGGIDCFFNNAGIIGDVKPTTDYEEATFDQVLAVNVKGVFLGLKHVLPVMQRQGRGAIVNTASVAGITGTPMMPAYSASKHAVIGLTKVSSGEVAREGIRVNAICPGPVATTMIETLEAAVSPDDPGVAKQRYESSLPTGRYSTAEEIADGVLFLCSDHASNITGTQFVVDGGRTATGGAATNLARRS